MNMAHLMKRDPGQGCTPQALSMRVPDADMVLERHLLG